MPTRSIMTAGSTQSSMARYASAAAAAVPSRPMTRDKVAGRAAASTTIKSSGPDDAGGDRLVHHAVGQRVVARADEAGGHRRGAEGDEAEQVADQPEGVDHQRHRGDVGFVAEQKVAGEPHVGEADEQVEHLLGEHRHGEPQHRAERARGFDEHAHGEERSRVEVREFGEAEESESRWRSRCERDGSRSVSRRFGGSV